MAIPDHVMTWFEDHAVFLQHQGPIHFFELYEIVTLSFQKVIIFTLHHVSVLAIRSWIVILQ